MKERFTYLAYLSHLLILWVSLSCSGSGDTSQDAGSIKAVTEPIQVHAVKVAQKRFEQFVQTTGKIEARREGEVKFNVDGIVSKVYVENGQIVNKGDLLATLEDQRYLFDMEKAFIEIEEKRLIFEDQMLNFKNLDQQRVAVIEKNVKYSSGLAIAELNYRQAKYDYENTMIKAYSSGIISDLSIKEGYTAHMQETLCKIHDPGVFNVMCEIVESDALRVIKGQRVQIQPLFGTAETKEFSGTVVSINPRIDERSGLLKVTIRLDRSQGLLPGMSVKVVIRIEGNDAVVVPKDAIVVRNGRKVVFVEEAGLAKWVYVKTGRENSDEVEVVDGLAVNQYVIVANNLQLSHNAAVRIN